MSCDGGTPDSMTVTLTVWTGKSTTVPVYFRAVDALDFSKVKFVRCSIQVDCSSGAAQARAVYKYTNDKISYDTPVALTSYQANNGTTYGAWTDVTTSAKLFAELGVECENSSGAGVELAVVTVRFDFREV
jgi:hypothetical protein